MDYAKLTHLDAQTLLNSRFDAKTGKFPLKTEIESRRKFDADDHWQEGNGFIGQLPTGDGAAERTALLRRGFSAEPVITEVLDTHVENVLGNEPQISLEDKSISGADLEALTAVVKDWYEKRKNTLILSDALRGARRDTARVLRAFIPSGNISVSEQGEKTITAKDLKSALEMIWFRSEDIEKGGVIVDEDTATELGLFNYRMKIGKSEVSLTEYAYLGADGRTIWGTKSGHDQEIGAEEAEPFDLGGHLPIYQLNVKPLITESVCQAQRAINLSGTMLTRNNNLAGSRERLAIGVQPPGTYKEAGTDSQGDPITEFEPTPMKMGAGTFNFLSAQTLYDEQGLVKALANPNVIFTDPVPIDSFVGTSAYWRSVIYSRCKMRHLLMADSATASGRSRIEARKEFQASLNESKEAIDPAGQWMIEVALRIAAEFIGEAGKYSQTKAKFSAEISTLELTPEENAEIRADYEAGLIDLRTALELRRIKNVDAVIERIEAEKPVSQ